MRLLMTVSFRALTVALALATVPHAAQAQTRSDTWSQFRGNAGNGVSESTLPDDLTLKWTYEADEAIDSSAAIVDGAVYVGTYAGTLISLDLETGTERWTYSTGDMGIGESSPAVAGDLVFIGDLGGVFHAVDTATGKARWTFETMGEIKSSPVIVGDRVLIGSYDGFLYALAIADGEQVWKYETQNYVHATPAVWDGVAYFGGCD
jgi:outer membrane protein assembly factor BamB